MKYLSFICAIVLTGFLCHPLRSNGQAGQDNQIVFSQEAGFFARPSYLKVFSVNGDPVRYTTNGDIPSEHSPLLDDSLLLGYTDSRPNCFTEIPTTPKHSVISYKAWESPDYHIDKVHVLRCASFRDGIRTSKVYTNTYFIDGDVFTKYSMPVLSLVTDSMNLFDKDSGIYVPGKQFDPGDPEWTGNYFMKGPDWERNVHVEYLTRDGKPVFSQDAGIRIHGAKTRHAAQKTLRLYAREEYGERYFNIRLFQQKTNTEYKRFLLRTTMGSWGDEVIIKDVLAHEIVRELDVEIQDYQPVIVYINGEYWGIHTIRDRIDERYIAYLYGYDKDSVDLINGNHTLVEAGSNQHYVELAKYIEANDLSADIHYDHVASMIDMNNFIDYMIARMYFIDEDWPGNNQKLWKPQRPDGKWRWIFVDLDGGFNQGKTDMFEHAITGRNDADWQNQPVSSFLFRNLLKNDRFKERFIQRSEEILNGEFRLQVMAGKLDSIRRLYQEEIPRHMERWNFPSSYNSWERDIMDRLYTFLEDRSCNVAGDIIEYFGLSNFGYQCPAREDISDRLKIVPNPNRGSFRLINLSDDNILGRFIITDMYGRTIYLQEYIYMEGSGTVSVDLPGYSTGLYHARILNNLNFCVKPIMIVK